jgi:hypothetical protein
MVIPVLTAAPALVLMGLTGLGVAPFTFRLLVFELFAPELFMLMVPPHSVPSPSGEKGYLKSFLLDYFLAIFL